MQQNARTRILCVKCAQILSSVEILLVVSFVYLTIKCIANPLIVIIIGISIERKPSVPKHIENHVKLYAKCQHVSAHVCPLYSA